MLLLFTVLQRSRGPQMGPATNGTPTWTPMWPKALQMDPKGANGSPKAGQRGPESTQRESKGDQKSARKCPNGIPEVAQDGQKEPRTNLINPPSGRYVTKFQVLGTKYQVLVSK